MTKTELIDSLIACQEMPSKEIAHIMADNLILEYIGDKAVKEAFQEAIRMTGGKVW